MSVSMFASLSIPKLYPTAHASVGESVATPRSSLAWLSGLGLGTILHCVPSQCSIKVRPGNPFASCVEPTAQTSFADVPETAYSTLEVSLAGFGLGTMLQVVPSKCSIKVRLMYGGPFGSCDQPTAHTSFSEIAATPRSSLSTAVPS